MDFAPARPRKGTAENIVPMINVVFLLLIFFLMTAQIAPPDPFEITPPTAAEDTATPEGQIVLYVASDGRLAFEGLQDAEAMDALTARVSGETVVIRADREMKATNFASLLRTLSEAGVADIQLVTSEGGT